MRILSRLAPFAAVAALGFAPAVAQAEEPPPLVFSVQGPGAQHAAFSLGLRSLMTTTDFVFIPLIDFRFTYGFVDSARLYLNASSIGIITFTDLGVEWRFLGRRAAPFGLAVRGAISPVFAFAATGSGGAEGGVIFGVTPGIAMSFGNRSVQLTLGFDVPMYLGGAFTGEGTNSATFFNPILKPELALEIPLGKVALNLSGDVWIPTESGFDGALVTAGFGIAW